MNGAGQNQPGGVIQPGGPAPAQVDPTLTLSPSPTVILVKKAHTAPARATVTVGTSSGNFQRGGVLTRSGPEIRLFDAAAGGNEVQFTGNTLVLTSSDLNTNRQLFAEANAPSSGVDQSSLTLSLVAGNAPAVGNPVQRTLTCVRLTLDIGGLRPAPGVDPPVLAQPPANPGPNPTDKWHGGRVVSSQDGGRTQERAQLLVRAVEPPDFAGTLELRQVTIAANTPGGLDNRVRVFRQETPAGGGETPLPNPSPIAVADLPAELFAEGRRLSGAQRDTGFQLGIQRGDNDGDRVALTVGLGSRITLASNAVAVRKPHTRPDRHRVTLRVTARFDRPGTLTRSSSGAGDEIRFFDRARDGTEVAFDNNNQHTFTGRELTRGVRLFAEGASASAAIDDFLLILTLDPGPGTAPLAGVPVRARMTSVDAGLQIALSRASILADPVDLSEAEKINPGRFVQVRDDSNVHERARLLVLPIRPSGFLRNLVLSRLNNRAQLFVGSEEEPVDGQTPIGLPHDFLPGIIPADGVEQWVEGARRSRAPRDTGFRLGIQGVASEVDRIEITVVQLDVTDRATAGARSQAIVRMGLWDGAFDGGGNVLHTVEAERNNFAGSDTRNFHFRLRDPAATGTSATIQWKTLEADGQTDDDVPTSLDLTLRETGATSQTFLSRGLLLVTDDDDRDQACHSGISTLGLTEPRNRNESNHRLRKAIMEGFVHCEYRPAAQPGTHLRIRRPISRRDPEERRRVPLQIFVLRVAPGAPAGVIPTAAGSPLWDRDLRVARETYSRLGVHVETVVAPGTPAAQTVTVDRDSVVLIDPLPGVNPQAVTLADETAFGAAFPAQPNTIRVFFAGGLASGNRGESAPIVDFRGTPDVATSFINGGTYGPYTFAHELGHILTNKSVRVATGHYRRPTAPANNRLRTDQNLMRNGTSAAEGVPESKRIWNARDRDGLNALRAIRRSTFTRSF